MRPAGQRPSRNGAARSAHAGRVSMPDRVHHPANEKSAPLADARAT
ncbi:hypothetical protein C7S17_1611 [Burkholderia thailandensis]|nr:hypothetical protein [Burkholderia thailandensis]